MTIRGLPPPPSPKGKKKDSWGQKQGEKDEQHTAHLTPTIQVPPKTSPFLRTTRAASPGSLNPILKQLTISVLGSGSVAAPSDLKYSTVTEYLSGGYPNTIT